MLLRNGRTLLKGRRNGRRLKKFDLHFEREKKINHPFVNSGCLWQTVIFTSVYLWNRHLRVRRAEERFDVPHRRKHHSLCATFLITETSGALTRRARDYGLFNTICCARHKLRGISHKLLPIWLRLSRGHWLTFGSRRHARPLNKERTFSIMTISTVIVFCYSERYESARIVFWDKDIGQRYFKIFCLTMSVWRLVKLKDVAIHFLKYLGKTLFPLVTRGIFFF